MNEDLSNIIEKALEYATPLPVTTAENAYSLEDSGIQRNSWPEHVTDAFRSEEIRTQVDKTEIHVDIATDELGHGNEDELLVTVINENESFPQYEIYLDEEPSQNNILSCDGIDESQELTCNSTETENEQTLNQIGQPHVLNLVIDNHKGYAASADIGRFATDVISGDVTLDGRSSSSSSRERKKIDHSKGEQPKVKRKRRREKNPDPAPAPVLPPCCICDDKSSGYHYGANTCEACKGFFRRTLKKTEVNFNCKCLPEEREAWKRGPFKNGCPACRYERCLAMGMSKNAIKIGRYTINHKTENIKKVKSIEAFDSLIEAAVSQANAEGSPASSTSRDTSAANTPSTSGISVTDFPISRDDTELSTNDSACCMDVPTSEKKLKRGRRDSVDVERLKEFDTIVKVLTDAQTSIHFDVTSHIPIETIKKKQDEYLEKYRLKKELFGNMKNLTREEFLEFYQVTGMDLDGRIQQIDNAFKFFEEKIAMFVAFAKAIPGFQKLCLSDQANLIKASRVENTILCGYKTMLRNVDTERRVATTPWGEELHLEEVEKVLPKGILFKRFQYAQRIAQLNLSTQELSVLRGLVIVSPDRCELRDPEKVTALQETLVLCLQHLLNLRPEGSKNMLYKVINLVTDLRDLTDSEMEASKKLLVDWTMVAPNSYHLLREFMS